MKLNIPQSLYNSSGVYKITNTINDKVYIGGTVNFIRRFRLHKHHLLSNKHHSIKLQRFTNKHTINCLVFELLEICSRDEVIQREQYWLDILKPYFNICTVAQSSLGCKRSEETKRKLSEINTGKKLSEETKKKLSKALKGRSVSELQRKSTSKANTGRRLSKETKRKLSEINTGKKLSEETKKKLSEASKGRTYKHSSEAKNKMSIAKSGENHPCYGKQLSEETRKKIRDANKGRRASKDQIDKAKVAAKNKRPVAQYNLEGEKIREFESIADAAENLNTVQGNVWNALSKGGKCKGYFFKYVIPVSN